jgi:hypothetical protein
MIALALDENFNNDILRGMQRRNPALDLIRVQDHAVSGQPDEAVLEWAAQNNRIVISHDVTTLNKHAFDRVAAGKRMPGVFQVPRSVPLSVAIEELVLIAECSLPGEWEGQVRYLPLR